MNRTGAANTKQCLALSLWGITPGQEKSSQGVCKESRALRRHLSFVKIHRSCLSPGPKETFIQDKKSPANAGLCTSCGRLLLASRTWKSDYSSLAAIIGGTVLLARLLID